MMPPGSVDLGPLAGGAGVSWWQTLGGLVAVFGLLLLCLRLLGRFQRARGAARAALLTVWHLGPKREIQVLRLGGDVHYVYRHDGAMVVLDREPHDAWDARRAAEAPAPPDAALRPRGAMDRLKALVARPGAADEVVRTSSR